MNVAFRTLVVWLMLLALPLQGFASASMLLCGPVTATAAAQAMPAGHDHAAMLRAAASEDGAASDTVATIHGDAAHGGGHDGTHDGAHGAAKCGTAGACCAGAPLAPSIIIGVPALPPASQPVAGYSHCIAKVDLAHPERPPQATRV